MKLVANALLGIGMQAIAEAVALGEKAGLDRQSLAGRVVPDCGGRSSCRGQVLQKRR